MLKKSSRRKQSDESFLLTYSWFTINFRCTAKWVIYIYISFQVLSITWYYKRVLYISDIYIYLSIYLSIYIYIHIYISIFSGSFHYRVLQDSEYSSLCHTRTLLFIYFIHSRVHTLIGIPRGFGGKESTCQCMAHMHCVFSSWVGKPTPVLLPGESQGQRRLGGYSSWGHKESDTTEQLSTHPHMLIPNF